MPCFAPTEIDWTLDLCAGDIVAYTWPLIDPAPDESPKTRPTLVVALHEIDGARCAEIVFGTGRLRRRGPEDVVLDDPRDLRCAGIRKPTRFESERRAIVPLDDPGFGVSAAWGTAILGRLPESNDRDRGPRSCHLFRQPPRERDRTQA
ncbi:hypothetical protein [Roseovarius sp. D0-M9]|uniref:hypothetical protein n=1 Tax=Roseovarius sp. D0-M9 TaxID=3127117 RepID=UPI0030100E6B